MKTESRILAETVVSEMRVRLKVGANLISEPPRVLNERLFDRL